MGQGAEGEGPIVRMYIDLSYDSENENDGVALDPKVQDQLGRLFRTYCDDLIHQPIPDKFVVLLAKLEAKQREKK